MLSLLRNRPPPPLPLLRARVISCALHTYFSPPPALYPLQSGCYNSCTPPIPIPRMCVCVCRNCNNLPGNATPRLKVRQQPDPCMCIYLADISFDDHDNPILSFNEYVQVVQSDTTFQWQFAYKTSAINDDSRLKNGVTVYVMRTTQPQSSPC